MRFRKLHGCGNSFIVTRRAGEKDWSALAKKWCRPHFGIGADGLLVISPTSKKTHFDVSMFNPDGSVMGMCGNGTRCLVRFLALEEMIAPPESQLTFNVDGRNIATQSTDGGKEVTVDMGEPILDPKLIPVSGSARSLSVDGRTFHFTPVSMGNPHCVIFNSGIARAEVPVFGPKIENHPLFPQRTNVEFVTVNPGKTLSVEVWERGAGQTLACGTGACAALVAAVLTEQSPRENTLHLPGGDLKVRWDAQSNKVFLTGPAEELFSGETS